MIQSITKVEKRLLITGGTLMFLGIIFGAFGAHALRESLSERSLESYTTGVTYQIYHGLGMLLIVLIPLSRKAKKIILWGFLSGVILFSFSIYGLSLFPLWGLDAAYLGPVTPLGGSLLILTWAYMVIQSILLKSS